MKIFVAITLVSTMALGMADISLKSGYNYKDNNNVAQAYYMQQQQQQQQPEKYNNQNIITTSFPKPNTQYLPQPQDQLQTQNPNQLQGYIAPPKQQQQDQPKTQNPNQLQGYIAPPKQQQQQQQPLQPLTRQYPMPNNFPSQFNLQPAVKPVRRYRPRVRIPKKAIVTKNFYIHSAPEETQDEIDEELAALQEHPRKHFNVLFVKTPSQTSKAAALNLARALKEEKTVVYVLAKKTSAADIQEAVQESHQQDSKPEVYFIKYRTPEEADNAQRQIQSQYDSLGGSSNISDEGIAPTTSVIGSLDSSDNLDEDEDDHQQQQQQPHHAVQNDQESVQLTDRYDEHQSANLLPSSSNNGYLPPHQY